MYVLRDYFNGWGMPTMQTLNYRANLKLSLFSSYELCDLTLTLAFAYLLQIIIYQHFWCCVNHHLCFRNYLLRSDEIICLIWSQLVCQLSP